MISPPGPETSGRVTEIGVRRGTGKSAPEVERGAGGGAGIGPGTVLVILLVCYFLGVFR
jgi:hypothetical protein